MKFYQNLTNSEKQLIRWGSVLIIAALLWVWVYQPMNKSIQSKQAQLATLQSQLDEMQSKKSQIKSSTPNNTINRPANQPFISWIDQQLNSHGLSEQLTRSEPQNNSILTLSFESVSFDQLIGWLQTLISKHNVELTEADFTVVDRDDGRVNSRLTLEEK